MGRYIREQIVSRSSPRQDRYSGVEPKQVGFLGGETFGETVFGPLCCRRQCGLEHNVTPARGGMSVCVDGTRHLTVVAQIVD
ncbi:hypothetical protein AMJ39_02950 [candidate division TA06 bacterium DG_24]|uniref:Uncharacterized protein n=2 Tax=Bacteria division TA06 TaxID=1156500 RepID=A0A0S8G8G9_UNCT6|nr:MAG: hypothetical protein AMJ39_02950 [candidate division TA06 bacterium DG_24]KPK68564.1 MAG: hypothetical protein AMJ82_07890 [candidate division TA06 bacterium SM23_40]